MSQRMAQPYPAQKRSTLADVCGKPIKADLHPHVSAPSVRELAKDALRHTGKQETAAEDLEIHRTRLTHKFADGSLTVAQIEKLGPHYIAELGRQLVDAYGPLAATPAAQLRRRAEDLERLASELRQLSEFIQ